MVAILALGIGSAVATFSVTEQTLRHILPYPAANRLVVLGFRTAWSDLVQAHSPIDIAAYRQLTGFKSFALFKASRANLVERESPTGVRVGHVSTDYFNTFGAAPYIGRTFLDGEDRRGGDAVVVLAYRFWREHFGEDPHVIGDTVLLDGRSCVVIGVLSPRFRSLPSQAVDIYQPLILLDNQTEPESPTFLSVVGRLADGYSEAKANGEFSTVNFHFGRGMAGAPSDRIPRIVPLADVVWDNNGMAQWVSFAGVLLLYIISCANVLNLMLARAIDRRKEFYVRIALGCSRNDIASIIAKENAFLSLLGTLGALLISKWLFPALIDLIVTKDREFIGGAVDDFPIWLTMALGLATALGLSLLTAWRVDKVDVAEGLKESGQSSSKTRRLTRLGRSLIMLEAGISVTLLVGAGLMIRTVGRLQHFDRGFDVKNKLAVWLELPNLAYRNAEARRLLFENIQSQLALVPNVKGIAFSTIVPLAGGATATLPKPDGQMASVDWNAVSPSYLDALGLALRHGKWFSEQLITDAPVLVVSEAFGREFFGAENCVGKSIRPFGSTLPWEIIGVVADIRTSARSSATPCIYFPYWQLPQAARNVATVLLSLQQSPKDGFTDAVRRAVYRIDPLIAVMEPKLLTSEIAAQVELERNTMNLLRVLGLCALGLTSLGFFSVVARDVASRMDEFGIRAAFGASPLRLVGYIVGRALSWAGFGVGIGLAVAYGMTRIIHSLLYNTESDIALVYACAAGLVLGAAAFGAWVPARKALRADITRLLHQM